MATITFNFSEATGRELDEIAILYGVTRRVVPSEVGPPGFVRDETEAEYRARIMAKMSAPGAPKSDPWVVVGTTTIDGTIKQVAAALLYNSTTNDDVENNVGWIDSMVSTSGREPWEIGGRHLRARGSHINLHTGTALIRCDIVRRQSEIDAEHRATHCINCEEPSEGMFCYACIDASKDSEVAREATRAFIKVLGKQCPECGPHGNRGRVALAFSEVACTTCAGGVPGDAFGRAAQFDGLEVNDDTFAAVDDVLREGAAPAFRFTMGERVRVVTNGCAGTGVILQHDPEDPSLQWFVRYDDNGPRAGTQLWFSDREVEKVWV